MQTSSIDILTIGLSLLCLVRPLHSTNYESYNLHDPRASDSMHRVAEPHEWYDRFSISKSLPQYVANAQYEETKSKTRSSREEDQFREPPLLLSEDLFVPEEASEGTYLQPEGYDRYGNLASRYRGDGVYFEDENRESGDEEELARKMRILDQLLSEDSSGKGFDVDVIGDMIIPEESKRVVREVRKKKPGLFWSLAKVTFQAINDTASAIKQITTIINNSIVPDSATASSIAKESLAPVNSTNVPSGQNGTETTTSTPTTTPVVLTRKTIEKLIRRNILGLVRVFNIEWKEALNQSETNVKEFQKDLENQRKKVLSTFFRIDLSNCTSTPEERVDVFNRGSQSFDQRLSVSIVNRCIRSCSYADSPLTFMRLIPLTLLHARNAGSPGERRQRGGARDPAYEDYVEIERITGQEVLDPWILDRGDWSTLRSRCQSVGRMLGTIYVVAGAIFCVAASQDAVVLERTKRQDNESGDGHVIDSIFNIPITALKQTAAAAQSFNPGNSEAIDSVLKIPVSTLEAVGNLVKATTGQRLQNAEGLQRIRDIRQERRDRILAQRERQRSQREQHQQQRFKQQMIKRNVKNNNKDPFGLNALSLLASTEDREAQAATKFTKP
ncbi:hypothetical protein K0M31_017386 [Melipona bicolor]|uniref:Uncharacterized protein n=1 Tax=Melipona bicolor TaxID=60889 RepID=A0AA40G5Y9_9HYME|nr:hypothetical protein K0M31_017386 [Melipona bicolor]